MFKLTFQLETTDFLIDKLMTEAEKYAKPGLSKDELFESCKKFITVMVQHKIKENLEGMAAVKEVDATAPLSFEIAQPVKPTADVISNTETPSPIPQ